MRVLVACEESQIVLKAFLAHGDFVRSCDLRPCSGGLPQYHIQCDVISYLRGLPAFYYDLIIAHPPCTYLTACGSPWFRNSDFSLNDERVALQSAAREFFMFFYDYPYCNHICIENPRPRKDSCLPAYSQIIQPYDFGAPWSKQTMLWLRGLPPLFPSVIEYNRRSAAPSYVASVRGSFARSKFFPEIASAMAQQWRF